METADKVLIAKVERFWGKFLDEDWIAINDVVMRSAKPGDLTYQFTPEFIVECCGLLIQERKELALAIEQAPQLFKGLLELVKKLDSQQVPVVPARE